MYNIFSSVCIMLVLVKLRYSMISNLQRNYSLGCSNKYYNLYCIYVKYIVVMIHVSVYKFVRYCGLYNATLFLRVLMSNLYT